MVRRPGTRTTWRYIASAVALLGIVAVSQLTRDDTPVSTAAPTTSLFAPPATETVAPTSTVSVVTTAVMPAPEHAEAVDTTPILVAARVFVVGWLAPAPREDRRKWLEPVTAPGFVDVVADIPADVLPAGPAGDLMIVSADEYRAVVHVPLPESRVAAKVTLVATGSVSLPDAAGWRVSALDEV